MKFIILGQNFEKKFKIKNPEFGGEVKKKQKIRNFEKKFEKKSETKKKLLSKNKQHLKLQDECLPVL